MGGYFSRCARIDARSIRNPGETDRVVLAGHVARVANTEIRRYRYNIIAQQGRLAVQVHASAKLNESVSGLSSNGHGSGREITIGPGRRATLKEAMCLTKNS
ncbi:MAG: hypothetical protein L0Y50_05040 [Beijerinckiaceae bacterium]|nr:hypothetical protein [Beijerinckiaceae bacterium]MCI0735623.1 hypothetical protein [Beijerinckiaceae bacterium]